MPFETDPATGNRKFSFPNLLALILALACVTYLFWVSFAFTKAEAKENTTVIQIISAITVLLTTIVQYYFGNSNNSKAQAQQISELQKTAAIVARSSSDERMAAAFGRSTSLDKLAEGKADAIARLNKELEKLDPESEEAKLILKELETYEKMS